MESDWRKQYHQQHEAQCQQPTGNLSERSGGLRSLGKYDINKINNVVFSIYHESEVGDVNLADPSATDKTKRLYKYLQLNYGSKIISSIMAEVNWNTKEADKIYKATGKYPAMNCYDFIHIYVPKQGSKDGSTITTSPLLPTGQTRADWYR